MGLGASYSNTTGQENSSFGLQSLYTNSTGNYNTALGKQALYSNTTASNNTAVGYQSLYTNTTGLYNTAVGSLALYSATTADSNAAFGYYALRATTTGADNSAFGIGALQTNTTGASNVAVGRTALGSNTTASNSVAVGYQALYASNRTSDVYAGNVALGYQAGYGLTTGNYNTFIGLQSGYYITTGAKNTVLGGFNGNSGGLDIRTASNYIVLSDGDGNPRLACLGGASTGTVLYTTNPYLTTNDSSLYMYGRLASTVGVYLVNNGTSWSSTSDERRKDIIEPITDAANKVATLRAVIGKYKTDAEGIRRPFLIAQDVQAVFPEAVNTQEDKDGEFLGMSYTEVIPLLVAAIKELSAELNALKAKVG
jgi:hypothetical protein